jgi:hypothetical protein
MLQLAGPLNQYPQRASPSLWKETGAGAGAGITRGEAQKNDVPKELSMVSPESMKTMRRMVLTFAVMIATNLGILQPIHAEIYQWVDEKGTIHFTEDYGAIPEKYRNQATMRKEGADGSAVKTDGKSKSRSKGQRQTGSPENRVADRKMEQEIQKNVDKRKIESEVADALLTIVSLWQSGKYGELYAYGTNSSRASLPKEEFVRRMLVKKWGLAPSWQTIRDVEVDVKRPALAYARAKIGYKPKQGGKTNIRTETYQMVLENEAWRINLSKILSAPK